MKKNRRNILIAVLLLIFLLVAPFWSKIKGAVTGDFSPAVFVTACVETARQPNVFA